MTAGKQMAVGAFVLGGIVLAFGAIILFGKFHPFSPTVRAAIVFQNSISGLTVGSPVTFRGVPVGAVETIVVAFDAKTTTAFIPVTVQLEPKQVTLTTKDGSNPITLQQLIARGLRAQLNVRSFVTGQSEIDLDFDPGSEAVLHAAVTALPEIPTRQSPIDRVKEQLSQLPLHELADNANATLKSFRTLSERLDQNLPPLIESLRATSDRTAVVVAAAGQAITTVQTRLDGTLAGIDRLAKIGDTLLTQRGAELRTLLVSSNQTVVQARDLLADLKGMTSDRGVDRANLDSTLRDLATAAGALRGLANEVERNPQLLLTGRRP